MTVAGVGTRLGKPAEFHGNVLKVYKVVEISSGRGDPLVEGY